MQSDWICGKKSPSQGNKGGKERQRADRKGRCKGGRATWTHTFSLHHSITRHLWLHWKTVTTLKTPIISQDCALLSADSESSFCPLAKCNKVVLNWFGPGHQADSLPWHEVIDNKQGTDLNFINWYTQRHVVGCIKKRRRKWDEHGVKKTEHS